MPRLSSIVVLILAALAISAKNTLTCGPNEQLGNCGRICEGSCGTPDLSSCLASAKCSGNGCQCKEGYLRNEATDLCIPASMCPPKICKGNEILAPCGHACERTCDDPDPPEMCKRIKCVMEDCICDSESGFFREKSTGKCVPLRDCPR